MANTKFKQGEAENAGYYCANIELVTDSGESESVSYNNKLILNQTKFKFSNNIDYMLNKTDSDRIFKIMGTPTIDLFATELNRQCNRYCSLAPITNGDAQIAMDAFSIKWNELTELYYANPSWEMIETLLKKVESDKTPQLILITPVLTSKIKELALIILELDHHDNLFIPKNLQKQSPNLGIGKPQWKKTYAVKLSGLDEDIIGPLSAVKTMNFPGSLNGLKVKFTLDSACSALLINRELAKSLKLQITKIKKIKLSFANNTENNTNESAKAKIKINDFTMDCEFLLADIHQDVILGTPFWAAVQFKEINWANQKIVFQKNKYPGVWYEWSFDTASINEEFMDSRSETINVQEKMVEVNNINDENEINRLDAINTESNIIYNQNDKNTAELVAITDFTEEDLPWQENQSIRNIVIRYKEIFKTPVQEPPKRLIEHEIKVQSGGKPPAVMKPRARAREEKEIMTTTVNELLQKGFIRPSSSPYRANVLFVDKKDGKGKRVCIDYRRLNQITKKNRTPMPEIAELSPKLPGARIFSKIDLRDGYFNVRMAEEDKEKTAFIGDNVLYEWNVMPQGLTNAPATFMQMMHSYFGTKFDDYLHIFVDDLLIYSKTLEDHLIHVESVFAVLAENSLFIKPSKCILGVKEVEYCGTIVSAEGVKPDPTKVAAISLLETPSNKKDLQSFLGSINWLREYIPEVTEIALPLTELTKKECKWQWTIREEAAFTNLKRALEIAPTLQHFDPALETAVFTDASLYAIGGWIGQRDTGNQNYRPVVYFSRKLSDAEVRYPTHDRELLAIVFAAKKYRHLLLGTNFTIFLDHKPFIHLATQPNLNSRQAG